VPADGLPYRPCKPGAGRERNDVVWRPRYRRFTTGQSLLSGLRWRPLGPHRGVVPAAAGELGGDPSTLRSTGSEGRDEAPAPPNREAEEAEGGEQVTWYRADAVPDEEIRRATLILCADEDFGNEFLVYGREWVARMIAGRAPDKGIYLLRCLLVPDAGCFNRLLADVKRIKGRCDFDPAPSAGVRHIDGMAVAFVRILEGLN
jgi:hypothetical protein